LKSLSQQLLTLEKSKSTHPTHEDDMDDDTSDREFGLTRSHSMTKQNKKDQNFKVVVRVRPPLSREIDSSSGFTSITQISK
jgi:hypothetical protein